jgi:hypothetical protein
MNHFTKLQHGSKDDETKINVTATTIFINDID